MRRIPLLLLLASLVLAACASPQPSTDSLVGSWKLTAYGPKDSPTPAVTDAEAMLTFDAEGGVSGSGGCNSLGGTYELNGDEVVFSEITSTLMACDDERMAQESVVTQVLTGTAQYTIQGNTLTLTNENLVLVFTSTPSPYPYP